VNARNIGQNMSRYRLLFLVILPLVMLVPACDGNKGESCPEGLEQHKGKCLTTMAIVYLDWTEGLVRLPKLVVGSAAA
jgi:hypothetical protein